MCPGKLQPHGYSLCWCWFRLFTPCNESILIEGHIADYYRELLNQVIDPNANSEQKVHSFLLRYKIELPNTRGNNDSLTLFNDEILQTANKLNYTSSCGPAGVSHLLIKLLSSLLPKSFCCAVAIELDMSEYTATLTDRAREGSIILNKKRGFRRRNISLLRTISLLNSFLRCVCIS